MTQRILACWHREGTGRGSGSKGVGVIIKYRLDSYRLWYTIYASNFSHRLGLSYKQHNGITSKQKQRFFSTEIRNLNYSNYSEALHSWISEIHHCRTRRALIKSFEYWKTYGHHHNRPIQMNHIRSRLHDACRAVHRPV